MHAHCLPSPCSKMFDIELCPLPFSMEEMFGFISCRFSGYPASVQEQALLWLHVSTRTHARAHTHAVLCPVHILRFCLEWVWIEQAVTECESPGRSSAEYESGSQNETERDRRDFAFHPICTHSLLPCIHGSISSFCQNYDQVIALVSPQQIGYIQIRGAQFDPAHLWLCVALLWCHLGKMFIHGCSWSCSETHSSFHFYYKG